MNKYLIIKINNSGERMNYSGEIGSLTAGIGGGISGLKPVTFRRIKITGSARLATHLRTIQGAEAEIRQDFLAQGWRIVNFGFQSTSTFWDLDNIPFRVNIEADVANNYSNQQHLDLAARIFDQYVISYGIGSTKAFIDITLSIAGNESPNFPNQRNAATNTRSVGNSTRPANSRNPQSTVTNTVGINDGNNYGNPNGNNYGNPNYVPPNNNSTLDFIKNISDIFKVSGSTVTVGLLVIGVLILKNK